MLIKTIDTKALGYSKADLQKLVLSDQKASHFIYRVAGEADAFVRGQSNKYKRVDSETGEATPSSWIKFSGEFIAMTKTDQYESAIAFLPGYVSGPIANAIEQGQVVSFAFDVYVVYDEKSATSYQYVAQPLRSKEGENRVAQRLAELPPIPGAPALTHKKK